MKDQFFEAVAEVVSFIVEIIIFCTGWSDIMKRKNASCGELF